MSVYQPSLIATAPLLQRIAAELLHCRAILSRIEHSVHGALEAPSAQMQQGSWQRNLQDIDLLEQNLGELALCLAAVAAEPAMQTAAELSEAHVLGRLRLEDLRHRLNGRPGQALPAEQIEIF
jgi:hypothetical protein